MKWLTSVLADVRFALRQLRRAPGFAAVAVLTLALGLGGATAIFALVDAVVLNPLPFRDGDRLVMVSQYSPKTCGGCSRVAPGNYVYVRDNARSLSHVAAVVGWSAAYRGPSRTETVSAYRASASFFPALNVAPALGRGFTPDDERLSAEPVALLSHEAWTERFGADPGVVGRTVWLDASERVVVGVMPRGLGFPPGAEFWVPLQITPTEQAEHTNTYLEVFGRLRDGATLESARAESQRLSAGLAAAVPESMEGWLVGIRYLRDWGPGAAARPMLMLMVVAVGFLLLITSANLASLLLARTLARRGEIAIRGALGASRARVIRQLVTESLMLALLGGVLGIVLGHFAVAGLRAAIPVTLAESMPGWARLGINPRVAVFALVAASITGVAFALIPALRISQSQLSATLRSGGRRLGGRAGRLRHALVAGQVGLALVLVVVTGLLVQSVQRMYGATPGIRTENVLSMRLRSVERGDQPPPPAKFDEVLASVGAVPGVQAVGGVSALPLTRHQGSMGFQIEGRPVEPDARGPYARTQVVTPEYFGVLQIPVLRGRVFTAQDGETAPKVMVVNRTFAERHFAGKDPVGSGVVVEGVRHEVVGVVGDVFHNGVQEDAGAELYRVHWQHPVRTLNLVVRTRGEPAGLGTAVAAAVASVDADIAVDNVRAMQRVAAEFLAPYRIVSRILTAFALAALFIAAIGLYGVVAHAVEQRTQEFGVRMALGASRGHVLKQVLAQGGRLAAVGVVVGVLAALGITRFMASLLYGVHTADPLIFAAAAGVVTLVSVGAAWVPAVRATRVDPAVALRAD